MRGRVRGVEIWVVVLVAVTASVSAGVFGLTAGHAVPRDSGKSALAGDRRLGFLLQSALEGSTLSPRPLLGAAFTPVSAEELASPNAQAYGYFGHSVAISGTTVVVGAQGENVSGDVGAGHAYIFNGKTGALIATLTSPNPHTDGYFGFSVGVSSATAVVGAFLETVAGYIQAGHAYIFDAKTGALIKTLISPNAQTEGFFGWWVAVSGTTVVVGAQGENVSGDVGAGHAYTFNAKTGALIETLTSLNAQTGGEFGYSVAVSGATVVIGANGESAFGLTEGGHVYLL